LGTSWQAIFAKPLNVSVVLSGKKYSVPSVNSVSELQSSLQSLSGVPTHLQGKVLFGGKKLKPEDILEDVGVQDGSLINVVPSKTGGGSNSGNTSSGSGGSSSLAGAGSGSSGNKMDQMVKDMMEKAGIDPSQMDEMMKQMGGEMPSMEESIQAMQEMMNSPMFQEYMNDPEKLEQSRQMILNNPMMKGMMASMPGFEEILNDPIKWRETMVAAANMYKNLGSDLGKLMEGSFGDMGGAFSGSAASFGMDENAALDELSEGED
jgi:Ubiquitin family.